MKAKAYRTAASTPWSQRLVNSRNLPVVVVAKLYLTLCDPWAAACQASCPSPFPRAWSNSCPFDFGQRHPTILSSVVPFFFNLQSFSASGSFPTSWLFTSSGQTIGASVSAAVVPMNIQGWFPLGVTGLISLLSKGLSRVFPSTIV